MTPGLHRVPEQIFPNVTSPESTLPISRGRAQRLLRRIPFTKLKSLRQMMREDKMAHADDLIDASTRARRKNTEAARKYRDEKKRRRAEEKRNKEKWSGIVRGFDPNAGLVRITSPASKYSLRRLRDSSHIRSTAPIPHYSSGESLTKILNPKLQQGQT